MRPLKTVLPPIMPLPNGAWIAHHVEEARRAYGAGSFNDILAFRIREVPYIAPLHVYALPRTFGLFLLGALVWRTGFFRRPISSKSLVVAACVALAVGAWMTIAAEKGEALFRVFAGDVVALLERVLAWDGKGWDG